MWTLIAFGGAAREAHLVKHRIVPLLGLLANLVMLAAILYLYVIGNADSKKEALICFAITGAWAVLSLVYFVLTGRRRRLAVAPGAVSS